MVNLGGPFPQTRTQISLFLTLKSKISLSLGRGRSGYLQFYPILCLFPLLRSLAWSGGLIKTRKIFNRYWDVLSGSRTRLGGFQEEVKVQTDSGITNTPPFKNTKA